MSDICLSCSCDSTHATNVAFFCRRHDWRSAISESLDSDLCSCAIILHLSIILFALMAFDLAACTQEILRDLASLTPCKSAIKYRDFKVFVLRTANLASLLFHTSACATIALHTRQRKLSSFVRVRATARCTVSRRRLSPTQIFLNATNKLPSAALLRRTSTVTHVWRRLLPRCVRRRHVCTAFWSSLRNKMSSSLAARA